MQQLLNQYSVPNSSVATLSGNRSVQQPGQRSSESKPSISAPKSLQPAFSSLDKPTEQSEKIEKDPKTLPILDAKPGTDFTLPKGRTVQNHYRRKDEEEMKKGCLGCLFFILPFFYCHSFFRRTF